MDSNFAFPRPQAAVPRPTPAQKPTGPPQKTTSRESNALRASVLDAALELGIGSNSLVADWMFNNALAEEDEEEDQISSPGLTYGSSATSEESSFSALTPSSSTHSSSSGAGALSTVNAKSGAGNDGMIRISESETTGSNLGNTVSFPEIPIPPRPTTPGGTRKLKKKHRGDGYESDGGYMSEGGKKKDKKKADNDGQVFPSAETEKEAKKRVKEEKKEFLEEERKRKKSLLSTVKASKKAEKEAEQSKGYDTDGGGGKLLGKSKSKKSKSKTASGDAGGYETDAGDQSSTPTPGIKKSKSRFFKLSTKGSRDIPAEPMPPMPVQIPKEVVPLPIAERFATALSPTAPPQSSPTLSSSVSLPFSKADNPSTPLPPLAFQPFDPAPTSSSNSAPPPRALATSPIPPTDRTSQASADSTSSTSSNPKRRAGHFSPSREGSNSGHSNGNSTLTSQSHQDQPPSPINVNLSSGSQLGPSAGSGSLKLPTISFPITRSPSPISPSMPTTPIAPLNITKGLRIQPSFENMTYSRNPSPSPISPASPYVINTPLRSASPLPALGAVNPRSPSPSARPRNIPTDGFGLRPPPNQPGQQTLSPHSFISPPNTADGNGKFQRPTHLSIVPSTDYIVPSRSPSPRPGGLASPNVLAYYDIPPPSPPPMGPLPSVPGVPLGSSGSNSSNNNSNPGQFPSAAVLRQRVIDRTPRQLPPDLAPSQYIQRGKESPFPARPLVRAGSISASNPTPGQEGRVAARRYGDLYPQGPGFGAVDVNQFREEKNKPKDTRRARFAAEPSWIDDDREYEEDGEDDDGQELRGVLDRFEDRSTESVDGHSGRALGRSHSFEALKDKHESFAVSSYRGPRGQLSNRDSEYAFDGDGLTVGNRNSRWSGSIYSRNSILDEDASGQRREILVKRVEEMLEVGSNKSAGMGMGRGYIPPVPKLPGALANIGGQINAGVPLEVTSPGRSWNKF